MCNRNSHHRDSCWRWSLLFHFVAPLLYVRLRCVVFPYKTSANRSEWLCCVGERYHDSVTVILSLPSPFSPLNCDPPSSLPHFSLPSSCLPSTIAAHLSIVCRGKWEEQLQNSSVKNESQSIDYYCSHCIIASSSAHLYCLSFPCSGSFQCLTFASFSCRLHLSSLKAVDFDSIINSFYHLPFSPNSSIMRLHFWLIHYSPLSPCVSASESDGIWAMQRGWLTFNQNKELTEVLLFRLEKCPGSFSLCQPSVRKGCAVLHPVSVPV